jgi:chromosomal replication initiator protein
VPAFVQEAPLPQSLAAQELWANTLEALRHDGHAYAASQLEQLFALKSEHQELTVGVGDRFFRDWVDDHYRALIEETLQKLSGVPTALKYEIVERPRSAAPSASEQQAAITQVRESARLNARFTFETYVVADSNQLPAAAAAAVADNPGRVYNPLFIYGGTGLGKTHLLHAVGNRIREREPSKRIVYLSTEDFTNQFIESVRDHKMTDFRRKFRDECDVLLVDDIQFLGKKQETQNEFFYTFNALHQASKAIVLTSDTVPSEIPGLEERLRSRFTMGLITDVQEPNFEMRIAILKKKALVDGFDLPDKVATFIAKHVVRNVRELEGALIKLSAMHSLMRQPLTEEFTAQVLRDVLPAQRIVDTDTIQKETARYYKVSLEDLKGERRTKHIAHARQVSMYLCRTINNTSFPEIGARFDKDHSTVISSVRKVEAQKGNDDVVRRELLELLARLGVTTGG